MKVKATTRLWLLLPALLFVGCAQPSSTATLPAISHDGQLHGGVYQISFQKVGTSDFSSSAQGLVQTQGLVGTPEAFTFSRLTATSTFVTTSTSTRYVQVTYRVTNNTGLTLNSLKFVPAVPTGSTTPFTSVKYFDGSDASSKAGSLTPIQAQTYVTASDTVITDAGSSPFVTGLDLSGVDTAGQGVSSVTTSGWQAASTLAPGASTNVTFAVKLPAAADPKNDPFSFSLNVIPVQEGVSLTSAVGQYNRSTGSFGNYARFPTVGSQSLPAYYDLKSVDRTGASVPAVLCSYDGATVSNISSASFPNRYRVTVSSLGTHSLQVYAGNSCPASAGTPLLSQPVLGVAPQTVPLAGGRLYSLALIQSGTVASWARNDAGQLGNGTATDSNVPVAVSELTGAIAVASGGDDSLALMQDGTVRSWGEGTNYQLGNNGGSSRVPVTVSGLSGVVAVAGGFHHSLALKADGSVWGWGTSEYGQLGTGTYNGYPVPVAVSRLSDVVAVACGAYHSLALKADGTVQSWGFNTDGALGDGTNISRNVPVTVFGLTGVVAVAGGDDHSLALKADGTVQSWGLNSSGQLGDGTTVGRRVPVTVSNLTNVATLAAGYGHSVALMQDGSVRSWGRNSEGELGNSTIIGSSVPVTVSSLTRVTAVTSGYYHSVAVMADGSVQSWGSNFYGQLGNNDNTFTDSNVPVTTLVSGVAQPTP